MKSHDKRSAFIVCSLKIMTMRCRTRKYKGKGYTMYNLHWPIGLVKKCNTNPINVFLDRAIHVNIVITLTDPKIIELGKSGVVLKHFGKPELVRQPWTSLAWWVHEPAGLVGAEDWEPYLNLFTMTPVYTQYLATILTTFWMKTAAFILGLAATVSSKFCPGERGGNQCVAGE